MSAIPEPLLRWAARPGPARVLAVARSKREAGRLGPRSVLLADLSPSERADVGVLLGTSWQAGGAPVRTGELRRALLAYEVQLDDLLIAVGGTLRDLPAAKAAAARDRDDDFARAVAILAELSPEVPRAVPAPEGPGQPVGWRSPADSRSPASSRSPADSRSHAGSEPPTDPVPPGDTRSGAVDSWLAAVAKDCLPPAGGGAATARAKQLRSLWALLSTQVTPLAGGHGAGDATDDPTSERERLAVVAARTFGDAHALDRDRPLGRAAARLAAHVLAARTGRPPDDPMSSAQAWREAWAGVGVACDEVSSQVLVLNLPLPGDSPAARLTRAAGAEPVWLTLRSLSPAPDIDEEWARTLGDVFVCENPSVVEASADRLGASCAPLICTFGRPGLAATSLLGALAAAGARLCIGADSDTTGHAIVAELLALTPGSVPWRMDSPGFEEERLDDLLADLQCGA